MTFHLTYQNKVVQNVNRMSESQSDRQTGRQSGRQTVSQIDRKSDSNKSKAANEPALVTMRCYHKKPKLSGRIGDNPTLGLG